MAILITYPKEKIPTQWQERLAKYDEVICFPFRLLRATTLSAEECRTIRQAQDLAITSQFGAQVFIGALSQLNARATIHVISSKVKSQLQAAGITNQIAIASAENRRSLLSDLHGLDTSSLCWLIGDHAQKYYQDFPGAKVITYHNTWDRAHQEQAIRLFTKYSFQAVLVTSPSNFERMAKAVAASPNNDFHNFTYFVLGHSTGEYLEERGLRVVYPQKHTQVLEQALCRLEEYEKAGK